MGDERLSFQAGSRVTYGRMYNAAKDYLDEAAKGNGIVVESDQGIETLSYFLDSEFDDVSGKAAVFVEGDLEKMEVTVQVTDATSPEYDRVVRDSLSDIIKKASQKPHKPVLGKPA